MNAGFLFDEVKNSGTLSESSQTVLIRHVVNLMNQKFGDYPTRTQKEDVSHALIVLFPCLKVKEDQASGIVSK